MPARCRLSLSRSRANPSFYGDSSVHLLPSFSAVAAFSSNLSANILLATKHSHILFFESTRNPSLQTVCVEVSDHRLESFHSVCRTSLVHFFLLALTGHFRQRIIVCGSPSSSTITDAMWRNLKLSFLHCLTHLNWGSSQPAQLLTALGMNLNSSLFSSMSTSISFC